MPLNSHDDICADDGCWPGPSRRQAVPLESSRAQLPRARARCARSAAPRSASSSAVSSARGMAAVQPARRRAGTRCGATGRGVRAVCRAGPLRVDLKSIVQATGTQAHTLTTHLAHKWSRTSAINSSTSISPLPSASMLRTIASASSSLICSPVAAFHAYLSSPGCRKPSPEVSNRANAARSASSPASSAVASSALNARSRRRAQPPPAARRACARAYERVAGEPRRREAQARRPGPRGRGWDRRRARRPARRSARRIVQRRREEDADDERRRRRLVEIVVEIA